MASDDDKHSKFVAQQKQQENATLVRKIFYYSFFATLLADAYASKGDCLNHLTIWSLILHTCYFELHLPSAPPFIVKLLHGPSLNGSVALFSMYCWTLFANPDMEFDLAPEGRATWLIYARGFYVHAAPIIYHIIDIKLLSTDMLRKAYTDSDNSSSTRNGSNSSMGFIRLLSLFWTIVGGYFAMGLTWEATHDAAGVYNVTIVSPETFVLVGKAIGVIGAIASFIVLGRPVVM